MEKDTEKAFFTSKMGINTKGSTRMIKEKDLELYIFRIKISMLESIQKAKGQEKELYIMLMEIDTKENF